MVPKKIIWVLVFITAILLILLTVNAVKDKNNKSTYNNYYYGENHFEIIQSRIKIELPDSLKLINKYEDFKTESFSYKYLISSEGYNDVVRSLSSKLGVRTSDDFIPNFNINIKWFNINRDQIVNSFQSSWSVYMQDGQRTSHMIYAYIYDENNEYYLYLDF